MTAGSRLERYRAKRDFTRTGEPEGRPRPASGSSLFVVQQHAARHMHYDFRLEVDGVLVSFALPKGMSADPGVKRLAVRTEDHPLEYAAFEGSIPEGEYGAGSVIVWDGGKYENASDKGGRSLTMAEALEAGHVRVRLFGHKLAGGWSLIHAKLGGEDKNWLLVKEDDDSADRREHPPSWHDRSVLSGRTIEEIAAGGSGSAPAA